MNLSEECFLEHVAQADFQDGVVRDWWGIFTSLEICWPNPVIWIAAPPRPGRPVPSPDRFYLRFDLQNYPSKGPTAMLWDTEKNAKLDPSRWPKGSGDVEKVFRIVWAGIDCLYAPWDRVAEEQHKADACWAAKYPGKIWKPTYTIVHYLRLTRELLHSEEYHGI
jgi:hypothetical protein